MRLEDAVLFQSLYYKLISKMLAQRHAAAQATGPTITPPCRMATVLSCFPAITASCRAFTKTSVGYERRVLALLRADTLKSYAAVFETVARNGLPAGKMGDNVILTCGACRARTCWLAS